MDFGFCRKIRIELRVCRNVHIYRCRILYIGNFLPGIGVLPVPFQPADDGIHIRSAPADGPGFVSAVPLFDGGDRTVARRQVHQAVVRHVRNRQPSVLDGFGKRRELPQIDVKRVTGDAQPRRNLDVLHAFRRVFPGAFRKTLVILQFTHDVISIFKFYLCVVYLHIVNLSTKMAQMSSNNAKKAVFKLVLETGLPSGC